MVSRGSYLLLPTSYVLHHHSIQTYDGLVADDARGMADTAGNRE
jgi:hypothetical protein